MFASALAGAGGLMAPRGPGTIPSDRFPFDMPDMMKPKAGMFGAGKGNIGEAISAAILGALASRNNPGAAVGLQMLHQRRNLAQQQELAAQERENNFQDFVRREAYKAANPGPVNNDTANDYRFIAEKLGPDAANEWLRNQGDPLVTVNLPGNRVYSGPRSQLGGALGAPAPQIQAGHIEDGFRFKGGNPGDPNAWEPVNGGPTLPASGGFQSAGY